MGNFQPMQPVIPNQMYPQQNFGQQSYNMKNQYPKMGMEQLQQMNYEFSNQNPQNIPNIPYIPPNSNMPSNIPQNMPVNMMNTNLPPNMPPNMNLPTVGMGYSRQPQIGKQA